MGDVMDTTSIYFFYSLCGLNVTDDIHSINDLA